MIIKSGIDELDSHLADLLPDRESSGPASRAHGQHIHKVPGQRRRAAQEESLFECIYYMPLGVYSCAR